MLTRFRLEATGKDENEVRECLTRQSAKLMTELGGSWNLADEEEGRVQSTASGYWGRATYERVVMR